MKCICGYEQIPDWDSWNLEQKLEENPDFKNGDKDFIRSNSSINFQLEESGYTYSGDSNCTVFACPECGTLKIEI